MAGVKGRRGGEDTMAGVKGRRGLVVFPYGVLLPRTPYEWLLSKATYSLSLPA